MTKQIVTIPLVLALCSLPAQGELLGHISDETEPAVSAPDTSPSNDRRIIYRVICTPGGEVLPDCEQPFHDTETLVEPMPQQKVDSIVDDADIMNETVEQPKTATANSKKTLKKTKKSSSQKKTSKKASAKKTSKKKK